MMSWFRDTNPHFWSSDQPQPPTSPGPALTSGQQTPDGIEPEMRIWPRERSDRVGSPLPRDPNPHLWPRDPPRAPPPSRGHPGPVMVPGDNTQPGRKLRPRERSDHVEPPRAHNQPHAPGPSRSHPGPSQQLPGEHNPHLWPRDQPHAPVPSRGHQGSVQQPGDIHSGRKIRPKDRPAQVHEPTISWPQPQQSRPKAHEADQVHEPTISWPQPQQSRPKEWPDQAHEPTISWPQPQQSRPKERPDQPHEPMISWPQPQQPRPQAHEPELELIPTARYPGRQEERPLHPSKASHDNWPLHPDQPRHEGTSHPRPKPKKQPTPTRPPRKHAPPPKKPDHGQPSREDHNLIYPPPNRTNPCTWFIAIFCVILWVLVILGGILILIFYLFYRPRNPHFEITNVSLNAAYLDMGYLLNADLVVLANFTNPNVKMNVDFNFVVLKLLYENQPIATQYIESFSIHKLESKLAAVEMVSSQIRLPVLLTQQLVKQINKNRVTFEIDGIFHTRSSFGTVFRYSYWLYTHCTIVTTGPPSGILVASKCITKR